MTNIQSLFQRINLKSFVSSLNQTLKQTSLPFLVLKLSNQTSFLPENSSLSLSRHISNDTLARFPGPLTIWSSHHLKRILQAKGNTQKSRIILKNPYKSTELLNECLESGVTQMVVDSAQEYYQTENFLRKHHKFKNVSVTYHWQPTEHLQNLHQLKQIEDGIKGLFLGLEESQSTFTIQHITQKVLKEGIQLKEIFCEGKYNDLKNLEAWRKEELRCNGRKIQKNIDICEFSEVDNYILATQCLCKKRTIIHEEARELIGRPDDIQKSLLIQTNDQQWLLAQIKSLPYDQQRYLFNIDSAPRVDYNSAQMLAM